MRLFQILYIKLYNTIKLFSRALSLVVIELWLEVFLCRFTAADTFTGFPENICDQLLLTDSAINFIRIQNYFSFLGILSLKFINHRATGKKGDYFFHSSLPLPTFQRYLEDIIHEINAKSTPLQVTRLKSLALPWTGTMNSTRT